MSIERLSVPKLLGLAVRAEIDSELTYSRLAERVKNPLLQEKFQMLAFEESKHAAILKNLFRSLYPGRKISLPARADQKLLPSGKVKPSTGLVEVLSQAMKAEKAAQKFYLDLARRLGPVPKKIVLYLSKVEQGHYLMLQSEYQMALQFEDYAEKDIEKVVT